MTEHLVELRQHQPGFPTCWPSDVVIGRRVVGSVLTSFTEDGYVGSVPLPLDESDEEDEDPNEEVELLKFVDDAAATMVALDRGLDPPPC